jgi:hypothetical protein
MHVYINQNHQRHQKSQHNKVSKTPLLHMLPPIDWFFVADSTKFLHLICTLSDSPLLVTLVNRYPSCHVTITDY